MAELLFDQSTGSLRCGGLGLGLEREHGLELDRSRGRVGSRLQGDVEVDGLDRGLLKNRAPEGRHNEGFWRRACISLKKNSREISARISLIRRGVETV